MQASDRFYPEYERYVRLNRCIQDVGYSRLIEGQKVGNMVSWINLLKIPRSSHCFVISSSIIYYVTTFLSIFVLTKWYKMAKPNSLPFKAIVMPSARCPDPPNTGKSLFMTTSLCCRGVGVTINALVLLHI